MKRFFTPLLLAASLSTTMNLAIGCESACTAFCNPNDSNYIATREDPKNKKKQIPYRDCSCTAYINGRWQTTKETFFTAPPQCEPHEAPPEQQPRAPLPIKETPEGIPLQPMGKSAKQPETTSTTQKTLM